MLTGALQRYNWLIRILAPIVLVGLALVTALLVSVKTELATVIFEGTLLVVSLAIARTNVASLVIAFFFTTHLCQFAKRFIFLWGTPAQSIYYAVQVLPNVFLVLAMLMIFRRLTKSRITPSAKLLIAYAGVSVLASLLNIRSIHLAAGAGGLYQSSMLLIALFVGMMMPLSLFGKLGRLFSALILISVPYGVYQFATGPTAIDRAWAEAMHDFSIEASKVYDAMTVSNSEFRAYSYYSDHTTWGLFLALALIVAVMASGLGYIRKKWLYLIVPTALVGLIVCETRTAWLALLGSLIVYRLITTRLLRRPMLLIVGVLSSFAVVVTVGDYVTTHVSVGVFSSTLLRRYSTVGTMQARTSAWKLFARNLPRHWLLGTGYGFASSDSNVSLNDEVFSHNMYVELLVTTGLPGLFLLMGFFYYWIKEAFWVAKMGTKAVSKIALWSIALTVGMLLTGSVQGTNFLTVYLCMILGLISGEWLRLKSALAQVYVPAPVRERRFVFSEPQVALQK